MGARTLVLLAKLIVLGADDLAPAGQSILFLGHGDDHGIDEAALMDAVAIYTRDLGLSVLRLAERRPVLSSPSSLDDLAALLRARGARLAFWCQVGLDGKSVELVIVEGRRSVSRHLFPQDGPLTPELYRAVALKLRATLSSPEVGASTASSGTGRGDGDKQPSLSARAGTSTSGAGSTGSSMPPAAARGTIASADRASSDRPAPDLAASERSASEAGDASPRPDVSLGFGRTEVQPYPFFVAIDYALSLPTGSAPWRNGAAVHGIASIKRTAEVDLGVELAGAGDEMTPTGSVSVIDVPVRLGARLVRRTTSYLVAIGVLGGLHALFARATAAAPSTRIETRRTIAGSVGLEILARGPSVYGFAPEFRVFGEANTPNTRFNVGGAPAYSAGALTVGFGLGLALPAR